MTGLSISLSIFLLSACGNPNKPNSPRHYKKVSKAIHNSDNKVTKRIVVPINYHKPSQKKPYPKLNQKDNRIVVSIKHQRAYVQKKIKNNWMTVYTMYVSTGSHNRTPKGHYKIDGSKTVWFYSPQEHEGAQYATGWKDGGVYLFHATPANKKHQIYQNVARDLGRKPSSHGCVHLTIPDAKWLYQKAPTGMQVIIRE